MKRSILVLMGTYNGAKFLGDQIDSIANQTEPNINLLVSDDGSNDGTPELLNSVQKTWDKGQVTILGGPQEGFPENYRQLILESGSDHDYYAYSDQDDYWHPGKLEKAISCLEQNAGGGAGLYCGRTQIVDEMGNKKGMSSLFSEPPSFKNAIVQSIAGGNTMVMNKAARDLLAEACRRTRFVTHDWWAYQVVSGAGGRIFYDPEPMVDYRQHPENSIGANSSWRARMIRLVLMTGGRFSDWNARNLEALSKCADLLTDDAQQTVYRFARIRNSKSLVTRLRYLRKSGIYRQSIFGQIVLYAACIMGKI